MRHVYKVPLVKAIHMAKAKLLLIWGLSKYGHNLFLISGLISLANSEHVVEATGLEAVFILVRNSNLIV